MTVRPAVPDDAPAVLAVRVASWRAVYGPHLPEHVWSDFEEDTAASRLRASIAASRLRVLVAEVDGQVCGYTFSGPSRDDDLPVGTGEVYAIYVHPAQWSVGLGRSLLSSTLEALGSGPVVLWVLKVNERARRFYERAGFRSDGAHKMASMPGGVQLPELRYRIG